MSAHLSSDETIRKEYLTVQRATPSENLKSQCFLRHKQILALYVASISSRLISREMGDADGHCIAFQMLPSLNKGGHEAVTTNQVQSAMQLLSNSAVFSQYESTVIFHI